VKKIWEIAGRYIAASIFFFITLLSIWKLTQITGFLVLIVVLIIPLTFAEFLGFLVSAIKLHWKLEE
jgi:hypothetical protein